MHNKCYMCKTEEETGDRIFLHCLKTRMLWELIFAFFDIQWVMHSSVRGMLLCWGGSFVGRKKKKAGEGGSFLPFLIHLEGEK